MISLFRVYMADDVGERVRDTLYSGYIAEGEVVKAFEVALGEYLGMDHVLAVNSGTSALQLACRLARVKGRLVVSTPMTCTATNMAILNEGGRIVWADVDPKTGLLDPDSVMRTLFKAGGEVAAIMGVDWMGVPCDWQRLRQLADVYGCRLIRDAAHSFGTRPNAPAHYTCYSFQAIKQLTTGDGGALVCEARDDHERARRLRWFGLDRDAERGEQSASERGYKFHMNDIAATIGLTNMKGIGTRRSVVRRNAAKLSRELSGRLKTATYPPWVYPMLVEDPEPFANKMADKGIEVSQVHNRNDRMPAFSDAKELRTLRGVHEFAAHQTNLPCGWWVTPEEAEYIAKSALECM